jgi:membrane-bound lytic murein transglycosylase F
LNLLIKLFIALLSIQLFWGCSDKDNFDIFIDETPSIKRDLAEIKSDKKLVAITGYNAYSYFIYKGKPMGYEYELLNKLADHLNLELEIKIVKDINEMIKALNNGEGDLIAYNLTVTKSRKKSVAFTHHHKTTRQVLVQSKPKNWRKMKLHIIDTKLLHSPIDLIGKKIHVVHASSYAERLKNLSDEIGEDLDIIEAPVGTSSEDLVEMIVNGKIKYTVDDENIAQLLQFQYPILDVRMPISLEQRTAWAVRKNSPKLLEAINGWLLKLKKKTDYYVIYNKYFKNRNSYRRRINSDYFSHTGGGISVYDALVKEQSKSLGWDWRLLSSLIYQESQFHPDKTSWAGAKGLMQLMPATAKQFGVSKITNPKDNLRGGVKYLKWLTDYWRETIKDSTERIKFVLASYNVGPGHIRDARMLAKKYGENPNVWSDNVETYLLKKSNPKYYNDEVVKFGYARGVETAKYVDEILARYDDYLQFIK